MAGLLKSIQLESIQLDALSYTLIAVIASAIVIPLVWTGESDIKFPYLLQRQSNVAPVRMPKETSVHRNNSTPHGYPLVQGLSLPTEKAYETRDGDVRDVWELQKTKGTGKIITVRGNVKEEHDIATIEKDIHAIGHFIHSVQGAKRVATYLPNDIEHLVLSFAAAFYGFTLIPLQYPLEEDDLKALISKTTPDILVASAGAFPLAKIDKVPSLKHVVFSVEKTSRHLDWTAPADMDVSSSTYHELVQKYSGKGGAPKLVDVDAPHIVYVYKDLEGDWKTSDFSQRVIIAGVTGQMLALEKSQRMNEKDIFLPVDGLWEIYTRVVTYTALASGATLTINSVAGKNASIEKSCKVASPTVIVASTNTLLQTAMATRGFQMEIWHQMIHFFQIRTLTNGRLPTGNFWTRVNDYERPKAGDPSKLRLIFAAENATVANSEPLNSLDLADLRVYFAARIVYGLTHPKVAGTIAQQHVFDYRIQTPKIMPNRIKKIARRCAHFGPPTPSVEVKLVDVEQYSAEDKPEARGEIVVHGPAVVGGTAKTGVVGKWKEEGTLAYVLDGLTDNR